MPYGKSEDINQIKKKIEEKMPDVNVDNLSQNDMQKMLVNEINKDNSIDPRVKDKINKGDVEGLKEDLINYLSRGNGANNEKLVSMLKNNDMDGLKNQLVGMLLGGANSQKKNEIIEEGAAATAATAAAGAAIADDPPQASTPPLFGDNPLIGSLMGNVFEGNKSDNRVVFLNSMRPFVSDKRQKSIDDCVKVLGMIAVFEKLTNKVGK